ncbi:phosphoinositide phospholipase C 2-like [Canna indica]|uniref:Phosphoinositide phospholipase C n=1 Tax=Canna indica TaxID=4628 RepID=A0AAQ3KGZ2_9LILI|nr:phosphoinositide phospholipase C 2-like [Canna indica]
MSSYSVCFCFRRRFRPASVEAPTAIKDVFKQYVEGGAMGAEELRRFFEGVQGDATASREAAQGIIDATREMKYLKVRHKKGFSVDEFYRYLFSDDNAALPPLRVYQDMNAPLSHYFIYTGHNSYLTGNQLSSDCSDAPIIEALRKRVRVVELDLWPNSTNDNVDVLHGRTLTSPIELIKCLRSIKEHAFTESEYPVIITLEDHLTPELQAKVAEMLVDTFGDTLYTTESESLEKYPSPTELKKRILISTKPPKEYLESKSFKGKEPQGRKGYDTKHDNANKIQHETSEHFQEEEEEADEGDGKSHHMLPTEYKDLIPIAAKKKVKGDLASSLKIDPQKVTRFSLSELEFENATLSYGTELIRFTQRNLLRIYPKGSRVTSSNYKPLLGWIHGAQMVALNMQSAWCIVAML